MNKGKGILIGVILVVGLIALFSAAFIVKETEQVIITQLGKPVGDPVTEP
jgi:membrane protease subunit HflC